MFPRSDLRQAERLSISDMKPLNLTRTEAEALIDFIESNNPHPIILEIATELRGLIGWMSVEQEAAYKVRLEHEKILLAALQSAWDKSRI